MRVDDPAGLEQRKELAERVRAALIACVRAAHEDAGLRGLCAQGAWEAALGALQQLDLEPACRPAERAAREEDAQRG